MEDPIVKGFQKVDRVADPLTCVHYLDTFMSAGYTKTYKLQSYVNMRVEPGHRILDVGCGTGDDVRAIAEMVGQNGLVVGLDSSEAMIAEARKRSKEANLPIEYRVGDAHSLDFENDTFDGCRSDRTFQHLDDPGKALAEMIRVARSGAYIVVFEPDWETLIIDHPDRSLTRKILNFRCDATRNGWMGRRLHGLFREYGLTETTVMPFTYVTIDYRLANQIFTLQDTAKRALEEGMISPGEDASWPRDLEDMHRSGRFFCSATAFLVTGRKP